MMLRSSLVLVALFVVLQNISNGQTDPPVTRADLDLLRTELKAEIRTAIQEAVARPASEAADNLESVQPTPDCCEELKKEVAALREAQDEIRRVQGEQGVILGDIATQSEIGGSRVRIENSPTVGREIAEAIKRTVPPRGNLVVRNLTNQDEWIIVSGRQHLVLAGAELNLEVAPGTVTTRLRHQQQPLTFHIGFPNYSQSVDIKSRANNWVSSQPEYATPIGWFAAF
jgi:hypothetical protein